MNASHTPGVLAATCALVAAVAIERAPAAPPAGEDATATPDLQSPAVPGHGAVVPLPQAMFQLEPGSQVLLDARAAGSAHDAVPALERAAALLNLAGLKQAQVEVVVVLQGEATRAALNERAYATRTGALGNPNLPLIEALRGAGARVFVCGQSLAERRWGLDEVAPTVELALSAATTSISLQRAGFAVLVYP